METFQLTPKPTTIFSGPIFYQTYKDADFLRVDANVEKILSSGYLIRQKVKSLPAGHLLQIEGMQLARNVPLTIKNTGVGINVEDFEFTYNRLTGLVAAYAFENRLRFPVIESSDAKVLGLEWNNGNKENCKLYLSAVSGTENMIDQFSFFPFLCGMRKFQLKKMPLKLVTGMGLVKNNEGTKMAMLLKTNLKTTRRVWKMFPNTSLKELETLINNTPEFNKLFHD